MSTEVTKLTQEEFEKLTNFNQEFTGITLEVGQVEIQQDVLKRKKEYLFSVIQEKQKESDEFIKELREKYGDINIDIKTGDFKRMESEENGAEQAQS